MRSRDRIADLTARLRAGDVPFKANDNIAPYLADGDLEAIELEAASRMRTVLDALVIDTASDHNTEATAERYARMLVREVFRGRYEQAPALTDFPNAKRLDELYTVGPIRVRSACAHHLVPILGEAWVGVIPSERVVGLSKFARLADWIMSRPQIQEEAAVQLADALERAVQPVGLGVVIRASHLCTAWRGVRDDGQRMTTSVMRGVFRSNPAARAELFALIGAP